MTDSATNDPSSNLVIAGWIVLGFIILLMVLMILFLIAIAAKKAGVKAKISAPGKKTFLMLGILLLGVGAYVFWDEIVTQKIVDFFTALLSPATVLFLAVLLLLVGWLLPKSKKGDKK